MANTFRTVIALAAIALVVTSASGQGPRDARLQRGDALDANPGAGTGGRNIGSPATGRAIESQLYVSGRTGGLTRFRGNVPYSPPGTLQLTLPGAAVRSFQQQSVGLREATSGYAYSPSAYYDRRQTVLGLGGITSGLASPGSNVPLYSTLPPHVANQLSSTAMRRYEPLLEQSTAGQLLWQNPLQRPAGLPLGVGAAATTEGQADTSFRPGATAIFGLPWQDDRQELLEELNSVRRDRGASAQLNGDEVQPDDDPRLSPIITGQPDVAAEPAAPPTARGASLMPEPGQDAFHDLLMAILAEETAAAQAAEDAGGEAADPGAETAMPPRQPGTLVIRSLAGRNQDLFNHFMTEAQTLMSRGQYYDAAAKFSSAAVANPQNPLSQMGAALAMFGAGEPVSAAFRLRRAMEIFPPIMETQMAVAEMMDAATFDDRLAELDGLLGEQTPNDSQMLLLLATYMHASAGQEDQAKAYAQRLADIASDALTSAYAQFVLTGKRPDEQTDQPAD